MTRRNRQKILYLLIVCFFYQSRGLICEAQNVTSPYSILGIGDIETKDFGRYFFTGNAAVGRRDPSIYNISNPASLSSLTLKNINFDMVFRGKVSTFQMPGETTTTQPTKDFIVKRVSLAFKPSEKTGIAFGLKPYSTVNYQFLENQSILDGNTIIKKYIEGSGGINQAYFSAGRSLSKKLSVGITTSFLFGSLQRNTQYLSDNVDLNIVKEDRDHYTGFIFQGGVQYYTTGKKWSQIIGITSSISTGLKGQLSTEYFDTGDTIKKKVEDGRSFKLPATFAIGYSATYNKKTTFSAEAAYSNWKYQKADYINSYTNPTLSLSAGMEFSLQTDNPAGAKNKPYVGWGVHAENSYLRIKNQKLNDFSFSFGGGLSPFRNVSVYSGIEFGIRGDKTKDQIREKYTQFVLGITLRDLWLGTKKYGRYY